MKALAMQYVLDEEDGDLYFPADQEGFTDLLEELASRPAGTPYYVEVFVAKTPAGAAMWRPLEEVRTWGETRP
jgi:hypothetical protein